MQRFEQPSGLLGGLTEIHPLSLLSQEDAVGTVVASVAASRNLIPKPHCASLTFRESFVVGKRMAGVLPTRLPVIPTFGLGFGSRLRQNIFNRTAVRSQRCLKNFRGGAGHGTTLIY